jgi:glycerol-3-phosphate dehydrogenase (NAD(P)+)
MPHHIAIIGSGSYSTAIIKILSDNLASGNTHIGAVNWWIRKPEAMAHIAQFHHNPKYLSSVEIHPQQVKLYSDLKQVVMDSDILLFGMPSAYVHDVISTLTAEDLVGKRIITVIKGVVPQTNEIIADYFQHRFNIPVADIAMITGPSHAEEIALEKLTYLTFASENQVYGKSLADMFGNHYIKTILSDDMVGAEYASVLKNVFALASGIYHGLGYGDNFHAFFITNALKEIKRFVNAVDPRERDIEESAYLGDLLVTSYSSFSRNRMFGSLIGKGYSVKAAQAEMNMVAEGYFATRCMTEINKKYQVDLPILEAVYHILYENKPASTEMKVLTERLD